MENWDKNEWQGKRKDQVEYSNNVSFYTIIFGGLFVFVFWILYLCNVI